MYQNKEMHAVTLADLEIQRTFSTGTVKQGFRTVSCHTEYFSKDFDFLAEEELKGNYFRLMYFLVGRN